MPDFGATLDGARSVLFVTVTVQPADARMGRTRSGGPPATVACTAGIGRPALLCSASTHGLSSLGVSRPGFSARRHPSDRVLLSGPFARNRGAAGPELLRRASAASDCWAHSDWFRSVQREFIALPIAWPENPIVGPAPGGPAVAAESVRENDHRSVPAGGVARSVRRPPTFLFVDSIPPAATPQIANGIASDLLSVDSFAPREIRFERVEM